MDKKIIIDDVDVAECQYLYFAIEDSIIDYKEYPRCSIGEAFTNNACKNSNCYYKQLKSKEQECERLKEFFETAKEASNCNLKALGEMTEWADKLEQTLAEIKEIAESDKDCEYECGIIQILQKINEVE